MRTVPYSGFSSAPSPKWIGFFPFLLFWINHKYSKWSLNQRLLCSFKGLSSTFSMFPNNFLLCCSWCWIICQLCLCQGEMWTVDSRHFHSKLSDNYQIISRWFSLSLENWVSAIAGQVFSCNKFRKAKQVSSCWGRKISSFWWLTCWIRTVSDKHSDITVMYKLHFVQFVTLQIKTLKKLLTAVQILFSSKIGRWGCNLMANPFFSSLRASFWMGSWK